MREGGVFQVGVDVLDDRVPVVGFVRGDRVEDCWVGGGEEGVEAPHVEQAVLTRSAVHLGGQLRDSAYHQPAGYLFGLRACRERGERDLGDLGSGDPVAGGLVEDTSEGYQMVCVRGVISSWRGLTVSMTKQTRIDEEPEARTLVVGCSPKRCWTS